MSRTHLCLCCARPCDRNSYAHGSWVVCLFLKKLLLLFCFCWKGTEAEETHQDDSAAKWYAVLPVSKNTWRQDERQNMPSWFPADVGMMHKCIHILLRNRVLWREWKCWFQNGQKLGMSQYQSISHLIWLLHSFSNLFGSLCSYYIFLIFLLCLCRLISWILIYHVSDCSSKLAVLSSLSWHRYIRVHMF